MVIEGSLVKAVAWYDNEWGYSNRCVELAAKVLAAGGGGRRLNGRASEQTAPARGSFSKASVRDAEVEGRTVLLRVDFNVPLEDGEVADDTRIRAALPTIELLRERGAATVLVSHLGRPEGPDPSLSMRPVGRRLAELIGAEVRQAPEVVGEQASAMAAELGPGDVMLLENSRFEPGETKNDPQLAAALAALADLYVNDAFGAAHRAHATTAGVAGTFPPTPACCSSARCAS